MAAAVRANNMYQKSLFTIATPTLPGPGQSQILFIQDTNVSSSPVPKSFTPIKFAWPDLPISPN
jgi:hypothetical protein